MRTLGIDLAAQAAGTGVCAVEWDDDVARVTHLAAGADDHELVAHARGADHVGLDCPLG